MSEASETDFIRGEVLRVTFSNEENGYCVLQVRDQKQVGEVTIVGNWLKPRRGVDVVARGQYITHKRFGLQFQALSITEVAPSSASGILKFLSSGIIKGIGPKTAERVVERFGEETLDIIRDSPERVASIPGVGKRKAALLSERLKEQEAEGQIVQFLIEHDLSPALALRIVKNLGLKSVEILKSNPYILAQQVRGIGFQTADSIALRLGIPPDAPERRAAALLFSLSKSSDDGHCYLPREELLGRTAQLLDLSDHLELNQDLETLIQRVEVEREEDDIYLPEMLAQELFCVEFFRERLSRESKQEEDRSEAAIEKAEQALEVTLSPEQRDAVKKCQSELVSVVTGGPGCGKTTVTRAILACLRDAGKTVAMAAPTGRAAQRMAMVCEHPASTLHRLLKYDPFRNGFQYNHNCPLEIEGKELDALIIDEASMLDLWLLKSVLAALPERCQLILVGDKDQLPSVGPGTVFSDLVTSREIPSTTLSKLFRRSEDSHINEVALAVNAGISPDIPEPDGQTKSDVYLVARNEATDCLRVVESLFGEQIEKKFGFKRSDITVLTPSNRGPLGTIGLNQSLQARLNPEGDEIKIGDTIFRTGDRVMQRVNNYQIDDFGVFNGDVGIIQSVDTKNKEAEVELWDGRLLVYDEKLLRQLSLAYASTVHRAQGSEMPCVILAIHESHFTLLERQLIYTAITRAKNLLIIVGSKKALAIASKRQSSKLRYGKLRERIEKSLSGREVIQFEEATLSFD